MKRVPIVGLARSNSYMDDDLLDYCSSSPPHLVDPARSIGPTSSGFGAAIEDKGFKLEGVNNNTNICSSSSSAVPRSADGNYFYFPSRSNEPQNQTVHHSGNYSQAITTMMMNPIVSYRYPPAASSGAFQGPGSIDPRLLSQRDQITRQQQCCKVEQFSSNHESVVSLSQDTSLSTDVNNTTTTTEISSSKHENFGMLTGDSNSIEDIADIDCLWNF